MDLFGDPLPPEKPEKEESAVLNLQEDPESLPDWDTPQGGSDHPRNTFHCLGYEKAEGFLLGLSKKHEIPHGLIFSGPKGVGKCTFAYRLARFLLKNGALASGMESLSIAPDDRVSRLVASGAHPDLLLVARMMDDKKGRAKEAVLVDDVRKVAPFLRKTASQDGGWRVVIVDDADTMNRNAQNALLKILEEPPAQTLIILIAHRIGAFVPTIRSRCRILHCSAPDKPLFHKILTEKGLALSFEEEALLYRLSGGSVGRALDLHTRDVYGILEDTLDILALYPNPAWANIHLFSEKITRQDPEDPYQVFAELLPWIFQEQVKARARGVAFDPVFADRSGFNAVLLESSLETLVKICDTLQVHFDTVAHANLDKRQAVLGAFALIAA